MKDFLRAKMSQIEGKIVKISSLTFFQRFTHYFVKFYRDRRLRTFLKVVQKNCNIHVQNEGEGGGSKAV